MRAIVVIGVLALVGCADVAGPCAAWDEDCAAAARFAEDALGVDDWDAAGATKMDCDEAPAIRGFVVAEQCWVVRLHGIAEGPVTSVAVVVRTEQGDLVLVQETVNPR